MNPCVIVPYRSADPWRDGLLEWCVRRWRAMRDDIDPGLDLVLGSDGGGEHPGQFNHPLAINRAAQHAVDEGADLLVVSDADTTFSDPAWLAGAMLDVYEGRAPWAMARRYVKVDETATRALVAGPADVDLDGANADQEANPWPVEWVGDSVSWAGLIIIGADEFQQVGGYDERYEWWGGDDIAFGLTADTILGRHTRADGAAVHLWHPQPVEWTYAHERHPAQHALTVRYQAAAGDPAAMSRVRSAR